MSANAALIWFELESWKNPFCARHGLSYQQISFYRALAAVGNHLGNMTTAFHSASKRS